MQPAGLADIGDRLAERSRASELWLLRVQAALRLPPPLFGLCCGAGVAGIVLLPAWLSSAANQTDVVASAIFFGLSVGVLAGFTRHIFPGAVRDLEALRPVLHLSDDEFETVARALTRIEPRSVWLMTATGLAFGLGHAWLLGLFDMPPLVGASQAICTVLLWLSMFWTIPPLLYNADIFSDLGRSAHVDLLQTDKLAPFGATAMRPSLFVIAMLCAYPILILSTGQSFIGPSLIGFAASFASIFGLFFLPLRGIRTRIRLERQRMLADIDRRIDEVGMPPLDHLPAVRDLETLLVLRERIAGVSSWPLGLAGVRRFLLYVVLPPLTWAGAALVEGLINQGL